MVVTQRKMDRAVRSSLLRLFGWIAAALVLLGSLLYGLSWRQQAALRTVFDDRVVVLHQLQRLGQLVNVTLPAELSAPVTEPGALQLHRQRAAEIWQRYLRTYLTEEERLLARRAGERLDALLAGAQSTDADRYLRLLQGFNSAIAPLQDLQVRVAEEEMATAAGRARWTLYLALVAVGASLLLLWRVWRLLQSEVVWPVRVVADALAGLSSGDQELGPEAKSLSGGFAEVGEQLRQLQAALGDRVSRPPPAA